MKNIRAYHSPAKLHLMPSFETYGIL